MDLCSPEKLMGKKSLTEIYGTWINSGFTIHVSTSLCREDLHLYLCILTEKWWEGRNHSKKHPKLPWMVRRLKNLKDSQNTTFNALMKTESRYIKTFLQYCSNWTLLLPNNAPIWSAASACSLNVFLTPFSSKDWRYSKILFPIQMGCIVCITPFAAFSYI